MGRTVSLGKRIRSYTAFTLFVLAILILLLLGIFERQLFDNIVELVSENIWPALIAILTLLGFVVSGVVKNPPKSIETFFREPFAQIASYLIFLFIVGLTAYVFFASKPGELTILLASKNQSPQVKAKLISIIDSIKTEENILVPSTFPNRNAGTYSAKLVEKGYYPYERSIKLGAGSSDTIILVDKKIITKLKINSSPAGADVYVNSDLSGVTPAEMDLTKSGDLMIELKKIGFANFRKEITLSGQSILDLGTVSLTRLFAIEFLCHSNDFSYEINNRTYTGNQRGVFIPAGTYKIKYWKGAGSKSEKSVNINSNKTITIP